MFACPIFFGAHLDHEEPDLFHKTDNPFQNISKKDVEEALALLKITLSPDQVKLFNWIIKFEETGEGDLNKYLDVCMCFFASVCVCA